MSARDECFNNTFKALSARQFFKLICGGSFSDLDRLQQMIHIYVQAGVTAIDVSASLPVVEASIEALKAFSNEELPLLMVSFPLDEDPHFRKIKFLEEACIRCGLCIPVCPTQVFELPETETLHVDTPACYGCGRCLPVCPTDALELDPFSVFPDLATVLCKPEVSAVEIHVSHADSAMLETLYLELGGLLQDKLISVCLRPQVLQTQQVVTFLEILKKQTPYPLIVQVDGIPMSGSDDPEASLPALEAAREIAPVLPEGCFLTISGGINADTASYLSRAPYSAIQGVGMGTYARQQIWDILSEPDQATQIARSLVNLLQHSATSSIISVGSL